MSKYLYNGIELPDINDVWKDRETYPYASIQFGNLLYYLILSSSEVQYGTGTTSSKKKSFGKKNGITTKYFLRNDSWLVVTEGEAFLANDVILGFDDKDVQIVWSNHDVTTIDNGVPNDTIYLAASDPVPVGGEPEPEPDPEPEPEPDPEPSTLISADLYIKNGNKVYKVLGGGPAATYYTVRIPSAGAAELYGWEVARSGYELLIGDVAWMKEDLFLELKSKNAALFTEHNLTLHQDDGFLDFTIDSLPEKESVLYIYVPTVINGGTLNGGAR